MRVCVLIQHDRIDDIDITLVCPDGISLQMSSNVGGNTADYGDVANQVEVCFSPLLFEDFAKPNSIVVVVDVVVFVTCGWADSVGGVGWLGGGGGG